MSDLQTLLARCRELGAEFFPGPDGTLKVKAPTPLPDALREEVKRRKQEILALLTLRDHYHKAAESVLNDCFAIDATWLADQYPALWRRLAMIDLQLTRLELRGAEEAEVAALLEKLVQTVQQARILYEAERRQQEAVQ